MRLAFLADIHGNLPALEAVIADLREHSPDVVYLLGDQINRCPWTNEVLDLLDDLGWQKISGNHEYIISRILTEENFAPFTDQRRFPTLWWTQAQLTSAHLEAMRQLPAELTLTFADSPSLYLTHGVPGNPFRGFVAEDSDEKFANALNTIEETIVLVAHTHRPLNRIAGRWHVLNPSSVGLPYNGDPRAQYMLLDIKGKTFIPTFRQVDYNKDALVKAFEDSPMREEIGPEVELHVRTALTGLPWSSDFSYWLQYQPPELQQDLAIAIPIYLKKHGPNNWAFR